MRSNPLCRNPFRVTALLSVVVLLLGLSTVPASATAARSAVTAAADAETGSMTGPVYGQLDPQTGGYPKLAGVLVTVVPADNENTVVATATTGPTGLYTVDGLAPGDYKVHFAGDPARYRPSWYQGATEFAKATPVTIYAGVRRDGVGTYLQDATTSIAGRVSGPYDAIAQTAPPVPGATVNLLPANDENAAPVKVATTAADGSFSMTAVPPGQYKVRVAANSPGLGAPRWYGGATFAQAEIVTITPGTHFTWVYVSFQDITTSIEGTLTSWSGSVSNGLVQVVPADDEHATPVATATTAADGSYVVRSIPAGTYKLLASGDPTRHFPRWYGPIDGAFVNGYLFTIAEGTHYTGINPYLTNATISVSGWVGGYDTAQLPGVTVELVPAADSTTPVATAITDAGGGYTITGIAPGQYKVHFRAATQRYAPEWWREGETITLDLGDRRDDVIAYLKDATSLLAGVVSDWDGGPLEGVKVDAFLDDDWTTPVATRMTGPDGSYRFEWLAFGIYRVRFTPGPSHPTYGVQWFPQQQDPAQASLIGNGPGFQVDDIDEKMLRPLTATPTPTISGVAKVGATLTANPGQWGPQLVDLSYQWRIGDDDIWGETEATLTLPDWTRGEKISVRVTGSRLGYLPQSRTSTQTAAVLGMLTAPMPKISGTVKVGAKLSAVAGSWGPQPVALKYQWRANNAAIAGATASTYTLPASLHAKRISVTVSGTKSGYAPASTTSALTAGVAAGTLTAPTPKISGTVKVGAKLTAVVGSWVPKPVALKYQWRANNAAIAGATASTYTLTGSLKGKRITVTVTGSKTGYATAARTSSASSPVAAGTLTVATPKISGTAKVGARLSASPGSWGPAPVAVSYQWRSNGVGIRGATRSSYVVTAAAKGKRITVTVTGSKTGYTSVARTSAATATVK